MRVKFMLSNKMNYGSKLIYDLRIKYPLCQKQRGL